VEVVVKICRLRMGAMVAKGQQGSTAQRSRRRGCR